VSDTKGKKMKKIIIVLTFIFAVVTPMAQTVVSEQEKKNNG